MASETPLSNPIAVEFKELGLRKFETAEQVKSWAEAEIESWTKVREATKDTQPFTKSPFPQNLIGHAQQIRDQANAFLQDTDENRRKNITEDLQNRFSTYAKDGALYPANSPTGQKIAEVAESNPAAALILLAQIFKHNIRQDHVPNILEFVKACIEADRHDIDLAKEVERYRVAMTQLQTEAEARFEETRADFKSVVEEARKTHEGAKKQFDESLQADEKARAAHEERMRQMEIAFSTQMKLRSSERYWGAKRKIHERRTQARIKTMWWAFPIILTALFAIFYLIGHFEIAALSTFSTASFFVFGVPTVIALWVMRLLVREYRENRDLAEDAEERVAMVYTFKALEYEEKVSDEERAIILQALFRPHGSKPEDTLPSPAWEAIVKRVEGRPGST